MRHFPLPGRNSLSAQPSGKRSRNRKDRWANAPPTSSKVDGFNKSLDAVLNSPPLSDHLRLGRVNELVFHRSTVEDQVKEGYQKSIGIC
jgi:hypothetical protein